MTKALEQQQLVIGQMRSELVDQHNGKEKHLQLTISDQKKNLQILENVLQDSKISKEMYDVSYGDGMSELCILYNWYFSNIFDTNCISIPVNSIDWPWS